MVSDKSNEFSFPIQVAFILLHGILIPFLVMCVLNLLNIPVVKLSVIITFFVLLGVSLYVLRGIWKKINLLFLLFSLVLVVLAYFVSSHFYDISYDGQVYHYLAIQSLTDGWNPIYNTGLKEMYSSNPQILWVKHYAKGPWYFASFINIVFNNIEAGKMLGILALGVVYFLCLYVISLYQTKKSVILPQVIALLVAFNPVVVGQLFTFYVDGILGSFLSIFILSLFFLYKKNSRMASFFVVGSLAFIVAIKFTAIGYVGVLGLFYLVYLFIGKERELLKKSFFIFVITGVFSVFVLAFNPYVTNMVQKGHPFYPLAGKGAVDIISYTAPKNFKDKNRFEKFYLSYTSLTQNIDSSKETTPKNIFTFSKTEFEQMAIDTRINAFGPLFSLVLVGSILCMLILLFRDKELFYKVFFIVIALASSIFINPEPWWARYSPQLWILPILLLWVIMVQMKWTKLVGVLLIFILTCNMIWSDKSAINKSREGNNTLRAQLAAMEGKDIYLNDSMFMAIPARMKKMGIKFTISKKPVCANPIPIYATNSSYCEK